MNNFDPTGYQPIPNVLFNGVHHRFLRLIDIPVFGVLSSLAGRGNQVWCSPTKIAYFLREDDDKVENSLVRLQEQRLIAPHKGGIYILTRVQGGKVRWQEPPKQSFDGN
jgi:hypothetical protein